MRESIYQGKIVNLGLETASLPDSREMQMEVVRHPGGAVIACINEQQEICMIRQFRHAVGGWIWELPAGVLEPEELALETAKRELLEETGVEGKDWQSLGVILSTPGFCDEQLHLFYAGVAEIGDAQPEENEFIEVHWVSLGQAVSKALSGASDHDAVNSNEAGFSDAKTVIGIMRAAAHFKLSYNKR